MGGLDRGRRRAEHRVPALGRQLTGGVRQPGQLGVQHGGGHRPGPGTIALPAHGRAGVEQHRHGRQASTPGERQVAEAPGRIQAEGVDDRREPPACPRSDDLIQQRERVR